MNNYKLRLAFSVAMREIASIYIEINYTSFQVRNNIPSHFNAIILHSILSDEGHNKVVAVCYMF
jgi:hypothetical protein